MNMIKINLYENYLKFERFMFENNIFVFISNIYYKVYAYIYNVFINFIEC